MRTNFHLIFFLITSITFLYTIGVARGVQTEDAKFGTNVVYCTVPGKLINQEDLFDELERKIKSNNELKIIQPDDGFVTIIKKTLSRLTTIYPNDLPTTSKLEYESCFDLDMENSNGRRGSSDIEYIVIPNFDKKLDQEKVLRLARVSGWAFVADFAEYMKNFDNETSRIAYCNSTSTTINDYIIKFVACGVNSIWKGISNSVGTIEGNEFFDRVNQTVFRPSKMLSRRVVEFGNSVDEGKRDKFPELKVSQRIFDMIERFDNISGGRFNKTMGHLNRIWTKVTNLRSSHNLKHMTETTGTYLVGVAVENIIKPELREIGLTLRKDEFKKGFTKFEHRIKFGSPLLELNMNVTSRRTILGSEYDNPNLISLCKEENSTRVCLPRTRNGKHFDSNDELVWTGPGPDDNNQWDMRFVNLSPLSGEFWTSFGNSLKSLWNFVGFTVGTTIFCVDRDPFQCKYCLWLDGFWDSINNCLWPYFIFGVEGSSPTGFDPLNPGCDQYSTFWGYTSGLLKLLLYLPGLLIGYSDHMTYPPGLHWCLVWNVFIFLFPTTIIVPLVVVACVSLWCLIGRWIKVSVDMRNKSKEGDYEREITKNRKLSNKLETRLKVIEKTMSNQDKVIGDLKTETLNLAITAEGFVKLNDYGPITIGQDVRE